MTMKPLTHRWDLSACSAHGWNEIVDIFRRRRAWVRGHLWIREREFRETTYRADGVVLPDLNWYDSSSSTNGGGNRFELQPWSGSLDPILDRQGYRDQLLKALSWRFAGYRRRQGKRGYYNKPVWVGEWPSVRPPCKTYLKGHRISLIDDATPAQLDRDILSYQERFTAMVGLMDYYRDLLRHMEEIDRILHAGEVRTMARGLVGLPDAVHYQRP